MKGANSTQIKNFARATMLTLLSFLYFLNTSVAQSTCACKGSINVSVDNVCDAVITSDMILANASTCGGASSAIITIMKTPTGGVLATGTGTVIFASAHLYIGKTVYGKVTEPSGINSCWTTIKIEDKLAPTITCPGDVTMTCYQLATFSPVVTENCSHYKLNIVKEELEVNDCNQGYPDNVLKVITREYQAVDESGNKSPICSMTITIVGLPTLRPPYISAPASKLVANDTELRCDADYAKIPAGQPFAGNPSPIAIGNKPGCGVPSILLWTPTVVGTGFIGQSVPPATTTVTLPPPSSNDIVIVTGASGANTQVCLTTIKDTIISFSYNVSTGGSLSLLINNVVHATYTGSGTSYSISVNAGDVICFRSTVNNTTARISNARIPQPFYLPAYPTLDLYCNILVSFSDVTIANVGCVTKVIRTWKIYEWSCRAVQRSEEYLQMIEIADKIGPDFKCPADITASTNGHACEGVVLLPTVPVKDNCSATVHVDVTYPGGILKGQNGGLAQLPIGCHVVTYTAYDNCYNSSQCSINVTVEDNTAPTVICDQNTVVSLTLNGKAWVPASSFDNGSYDECELGKMLVRRMEQSPYSTHCTPCKVPEFASFTHLGAYAAPNSGDTARHYYYIAKHKASIKAAQKTATAMGGHLVVLNNAAEDKWVYDKVQEWHLGEDYMIGLTDPKRKGVFSWVNGSTATYRNWEDEYPRYDGMYNPVNEWPYTLVSDESGQWRDFNSESCREPEYLYVVEITDPCGFSEYVGFCCKDVGTPTPHLVVFRAVDKAGNYNDCMVSVTVQDKLPPAIICPPHMTITCEDYFDVAKLAHTFGWPTALDNCENPRITTDSIVDLNSCRIGTITRNFTATDAGGRTAKCTQIIHIENGENAFEMTERRWARDTTFVGCADPTSNVFSPDRLGRPDLSSQSICALVGAEYDDQIFTFNNPTGNACFKILRHWTVIDWCQRRQNDGGGYTYRTWTDTQVILVSDNEKPRITSDCGKKSAKTFDSVCKDGYIELLASATDVCTRTLNYHYQIDLFNNGSFDSGLSKSGIGNSADASNVYPIGLHKIVWAFEDNCGNITKCEQLFEIVNEKAPTPYCLNGLATSLMPVDNNNDGVIDGGMIDIWAKDFDRGSSHPCIDSVILSFQPVTRNATTNKLIVKDSLQFRCSKRGNQAVRLYAAVVMPDGRIIQDYCETFISIQDNNKVCGTTNNRIAGGFTTEEDVPVKDVEVTLEGSEMKAKTANDGLYAFENMNTGGSYVVMPEKNNDHANGVSTLDLVLIQRHILGLSKITSPYKLIAADINKDNKVNASDLIELRKVILGITNTFPNNESWRFVDKAYTFQDPNNAYAEAFPEVNYIPSFDQNMVVDFKAIKVGDVNANAVANATDNTTESRAARKLILSAADQSFVAGDLVTIPMIVTESTDITGFQFTINFDTDLFNLEGVTGGINGMTDQNFGFSKVTEGMVSTSFNRAENISLAGGQRIVELTLKAKAAGTIAQSLWIDNSITTSEAYTDDNSVMNIDFSVQGRTVESVLLYQNTPNPFKATTIIGFDLPTAMDATMTIYDVTGKTIKVISNSYAKGYNAVEINKNELGSAGVMYYTLEAGSFKTTRKMIVIE